MQDSVAFIDTLYIKPHTGHVDAKEILRVLEDVGLSEKAAAVYVSLLCTNRLGVAELARATGVKRATCYEHLKQLLQKDFVVRIPIGKRTFYSAQDPHKILVALKQKTKAFEQTVEDMSRLHATAHNKPRVTFYEGKREIKNIYTDLFQTMGDTYSIFPAEAFFKNFTEAEYDEFDKENSLYAFKTKDLFIADKNRYKQLRAMREKNGYENKSDKKLPDWFTSNVDVLIFKDKVALISLSDLSAIVIENKDIADLFVHMHQYMWKTL